MRFFFLNSNLVSNSDDGVFLQLENMSKIEIIDELVLSTDNLRRGIIPPETRILDDDEKNKAKRSRIQKNLDDSGINFSRVDLDEVSRIEELCIMQNL